MAATLVLNLVLLPKLSRRATPRTTPLVSIIIPARDEAAAIGSTVRSMCAQTYPCLEIIVVDDHSSDGTGAIASAAAEGDARVRVLRAGDKEPGWLGKPWALSQGAGVADGEMLLFVDADVDYEPDAVAALVGELQSSGFAALTVFPRLRLESFWEKVAMPQLATLFFSTVPVWLSNLTRLALLGVGGGPGNLVWRHAYDRAGSHDAIRDAVVDDVALMRRVRASGGRTIVVRSGELISLRMYSGLREIVDGFTKNAYAALGSSLFAAAFALVMIVVVHLMPWVWLAQWLIGGAETDASPIALGAAIVPLLILTRLLLFSALHYDVRFALLAHPLMALVWGYIIARSTWFAGIRRKIVWRGREYDSRNIR